MNKMAFGQYYNTNSIIHKIDARIKIIITILFMVSIFLVPLNNFIIMSILFLVTFILILLTKVPLLKYLKSLKQIIFLLVFSFIFQSIFRQTGKILLEYNLKLTIINIIISLSLLVLFFMFLKHIPFKFISFILLTILIIYILGKPIYGVIFNDNITIKIYEEGIIFGTFIIYRVLTLILFTTILTLTTKPIELNNALESLLSPLEKLKIKTSIFAMMVSIALRFIPTLFLEADKILKAQASRGSDFNEGKIKDKIAQIIALLIPMFIVSFKRAEDLAIAMEARGYAPGEKRTKLHEAHITFIDILWLLLFIVIITSLIIIKVML